jgi:acetyl-CoA synthetase
MIFSASQSDRIWTPADWAWIGGLLDVLMPALYLGVPVVACRFKKFTPEAAFQLLQDQNPQRLPAANGAEDDAPARPPEDRWQLNLRSSPRAAKPSARTH